MNVLTVIPRFPAGYSLLLLGSQLLPFSPGFVRGCLRQTRDQTFHPKTRERRSLSARAASSEGDRPSSGSSALLWIRPCRGTDEEGAGGAHPETSHHFTLPFSARNLQLGKKPHVWLTGKPQGQVYLERFVPRAVGHHSASAGGDTAGQGRCSDELPNPKHLPAGSWSRHWLLSGCFHSRRICGILREFPGAPSTPVIPFPGDFTSWGDCKPSALPQFKEEGRRSITPGGPQTSR